jgi:hypothetical protein
MAWVALTFALTIGAAANWMVTRPSAKIRNSATLYRILATCVAASFAILSIKRGQTWESFPGLASDVIDRYPLSLRAYSNLQYASNLRGEYQETLNLHKEIIQQYAEIKRRNAIDPLGRLYDITYAERAYLMSEGHCGIAIAGLQGTGPGITYIKNKIRELNASNPELFEEIDEVHAPRITPLIMNLHSLEAAAKIGAPPKPKS